VLGHAGAVLAIAHRSGNTVEGMKAALDAGVDLVEADVHAYRGRLEVRHLRSSGGLPLLWDKDTIVPRGRHPTLVLRDLVRALGDDNRLMIDLKGVHPRLAPSVAALLREATPDRELTVCTKAWWMLDAFDVPVRRVWSAASRRGLARLRERLRDPRRSAQGVSVRRSLLTRDIVRELHDASGLVMAWPVDTTEALAQARSLGVDAVISKDLALLGRVVAER
jgi:glycerophosphoryl diester phosphodiesterase